MNSSCLVLKSDPDIEAVLRQMMLAVKSLNRILGTCFENAGHDSDGTIQRFYWSDYASRDDDSGIQLIDDSEMPAQYLLVKMPSQAMLDRVVALVREALPVIDCSELKGAARSNMESHPASLAVIGLGCAASFDAEVVELIRRGLESQNDQVRNAALTAAYLLNRAELAPLLERALEKEENVEVRRGLEFALRILQERFGLA